MSASGEPPPQPPLLPLFPLNTVLFPGGTLPLRVFEPRYVDMVSACLKNGTEFGVCLISEGREVGAPAEPADAGCRAHISDWDVSQPGMLNITTTGTQRFRVLSTRVSPAGLVEARVVDIADDAAEAVPAELAHCARLLEQVIGQINAQQGGGARPPIAPPYRYEDAAWVANRLAELLPVPLPMRQRLMVQKGGAARLAEVARILAEHNAR